MNGRARWWVALMVAVPVLTSPSRTAAETWSLIGSLVQSGCPAPFLNGQFAASGVLRAMREGERLTALGTLGLAEGGGASRISVTLRGIVRGDAFDGSVRFLGPAEMRGRGRAAGVLSGEQVWMRFAGAREERSRCDLSGEFTGRISR